MKMCYHKFMNSEKENISGNDTFEYLEDLFSKKDMERAFVTIKNTTNLLQISKQGDSIIGLSIIFNQLSILKYLVESRKVDINMERGSGMIPLHDAIIHANYDIIDYLVTNHANVNAINRSGDSPLSLAIESAPKKVIELLIKSGANKKYVHPQYGSMEKLARAEGRDDLIPLLTEKQ